MTFFALMLAAIVALAQEIEPEAQPEGPYMTFQELEFDFGDITEGDKVEHKFVFENTGTLPLIITNIRVTCGCTATDWSRDPLPPGEESSITVQFNSTGKMGKQNKVISIVSNASNPLPQVRITTNVLPKK